MSGVRVYEPAAGTVVDATAQGDGSMRQNVTAFEGGTWHVVVDSGTVSVTDGRGLTERMFAKAPQSGYHLYLDGANADGYTYIAEAPNGATSPSTVWQGIRLPTSGAGAVQTATAFDWANRTTATWSS